MSRTSSGRSSSSRRGRETHGIAEDDAVFRELVAQRIDQLDPLVDEQVAGAKKHRAGLLRGRLHGHGPHGRAQGSHPIKRGSVALFILMAKSDGVSEKTGKGAGARRCDGSAACSSGSAG